MTKQAIIGFDGSVIGWQIVDEKGFPLDTFASESWCDNVLMVRQTWSERVELSLGLPDDLQPTILVQ